MTNEESMTEEDIAFDGARHGMTRILITGGPRTGKTVLADQMAHALAELSPAHTAVLRHTDSLIGTHDWSQASAQVACWFDEPGPWIIEGVAVPRALRKWRTNHPNEAPPVDRVIYLREAHQDLTAGQQRMAVGVRTVWAEVADWIEENNVEIDYR